MPVQLSLDHLPELWPNKFRGGRVGALVHPPSVSSKLEHASRILKRHSRELFRLAAFFGPQHGFLGQTQDNMVEWKSYEHPRLHIPVYSLYGDHREPTAEMLQGLDVLVVDLQDIGSRYYTFVWTLYLCMRACEKSGVAVVVLDRPNPLNGITTEGLMLDPNYKSFVGMLGDGITHGRPVWSNHIARSQFFMGKTDRSHLGNSSSRNCCASSPIVRPCRTGRGYMPTNDL